MPRRSRPPSVSCDLGVTGKQVRRALPLIPPPPSFRDALRQELSQRVSGPAIGTRVSMAGDPARTP
jgi:hypothetical protein